MGFSGGNSGNGGGGTPTQASIRIPQARLQVVAKNEDDHRDEKLPLNVFYDAFGDDTWLNYNPKVYLFRYKKRMKKRRDNNHRPNPAVGNERTEAGFVHTENGVDANNGINKITEWNANIMLPAQGNGTNRPFYKKHATTIRLNMSDWLRQVASGKYCPRGGATSNTRYSEYFKFCYCIEKDGKILFGALSTETVKMRVENLKSDTGRRIQMPILKLV